METGPFSLTEMTLITRCLKSYKREKRGQKLPANLSHVEGKHEDCNHHVEELDVRQYFVLFSFLKTSYDKTKKVVIKKRRFLSNSSNNPRAPLKSLSIPICTIQCQAQRVFGSNAGKREIWAKEHFSLPS